jgi:methyl-accepting chemotaxis protein
VNLVKILYLVFVGATFLGVLFAVIFGIVLSCRITNPLAQGDLTVQMNGHYKGDFALRDSIETMVRGLKGMAGQSQQSTISMTTATAQILTSSTQMAATTREQAGKVAQLAHSVFKQATCASEAAQHGSHALGAAMNGMEDIRSKVEAIAENMLALSEQT